MSAGRELVSVGTRGRFRDLMTGSTLSQIGRAFQDEGFAPDPNCSYEDTSERRTLTQEHMNAVDWTEPSHVARALRVFERLIEDFEDQYREPLRKALRRDGYELDAEGVIIRLGPEPVILGSMAGLRDPAAIIDNLDRIQRAIGTDPAQAIGSAKELIESTAKTVLLERGLPLNDHDDLPALVRQAQQALDLHPSTATPGPDGSDAVKKILGSVTSVAIGVAELRNRGYATGHGAGSARVGLHPRHAQLAVNAAVTWCQLILDTLADPTHPGARAPRTRRRRRVTSRRRATLITELREWRPVTRSLPTPRPASTRRQQLVEVKEQAESQEERALLASRGPASRRRAAGRRRP